MITHEEIQNLKQACISLSNCKLHGDAVFITPNGTQLFLSSYSNGKVYLWDEETEQIIVSVEQQGDTSSSNNNS